jgi:hypothetical protein
MITSTNSGTLISSIFPAITSIRSFTLLLRTSS